MREQNKKKIIVRLEVAKAIIANIWFETDIDEIGDVLCDIDEAINAVENLDLKGANDQ